MPLRITPRLMADVMTHPRWCMRMLRQGGSPQLVNLARSTGMAGNLAAKAGARSRQMDMSLRWQDMDWLRAHWPGRVLVKGILSVGDALRARAVRVGQVGDGELAQLGVAGVGVLCQRLLPVPHLVALGGRVAKLVVEANLGNAVHIAQAFGQLELGVTLHAAFQRGDDLGLQQAGAARATHGQDEREAKARVVLCVELLDLVELRRRAMREPSLVLLIRAL
eukprot:gene33776-biopygen26023